jgi:hypothetical protein
MPTALKRHLLLSQRIVQLAVHILLASVMASVQWPSGCGHSLFLNPKRVANRAVSLMNNGIESVCLAGTYQKRA